MAESVKSIGNASFAQQKSIFEKVKNKVSYFKPVSHTDLISQIEREKNPTLEKIQDLKKETDSQSKKFVEKASLYTTVSLLHFFSNNGTSSLNDDNKFRLIVKDLSSKKNPGFFSIVSAMKSYFPNLSSFKIFFFYFLFAGWLPNLYIERSLDKILHFSRNKLKEGYNLPVLGSKLLGTANTYLANYNRTVQRFRDDKKNPIGDRDSFIRQELKRPELLEYPSVDHLHKYFAKAASREETRPSFRYLSNPIRKFQLLDFQFLKKHLNFVRTILMPFTIIICIIPYFIARMTEYIPNWIIKKVQTILISYSMPCVLKNTLESVSQSGFTHSINTVLCQVIQDLLTEMKKKPEEKTIDDTPNIVNESLDKDIHKFSELLYTLLTNEPCKTQESLQYFKEHGPECKSWMEKFIRSATQKGWLDRQMITPIFVASLHAFIVDGFNLLFAKPEKLEQYLCTLIALLNKLFEYVPDPESDEGKALLEEMKEKHKRREKLVDDLIEKGINIATEDKVNEYFPTCLNMLSKHQKENLLLAYRKAQMKASDKIPNIDRDAADILNTSGIVQPNAIQAKHAKEDIQKAMRDMERLFISIGNVISEHNDPVKAKMTNHLKPFMKNEQILKDCIIQINRLHDRKENLKLIKTHAESLKTSIATFSNNPKQLAAIEDILLKLTEINKKQKEPQFDKIMTEYNKLYDQLKKIKTHDIVAGELEKLLTTTFFTNNLIFKLAKAQKEYLLNPASKNNEQILSSARDKTQTFLKQLESLGYLEDINEIKSAMKKILDAQHAYQIEELYQNALSCVRKKMVKHKSLNQDEQTVLSSHFEKCGRNIEKYLSDFPKMLQETHNELIKHAEILTSTVEQMQKSLGDIGKQGLADKLDAITITKILGSIASFSAGYLSYIGKALSLAAGFSALGSTVITPSGMGIGAGKILASKIAVPIAKSAVDSTWGVVTNPSFYEGLIHAYMRQFINYVKEIKGNL